MTSGRSGRRPGDSGTRGAILSAARRLFAERGFDRTSMRAIAFEAGVDPALVTHFHGSKQRLFAAVTDLPFDPGAVLPHLLEGDAAAVGERLARFIVAVLETEEGRGRVIGMVRAAASEDEAARLVRERVTREILTPLAERLGASNPDLRASLVSSQVVGLVMARYVVRIEPLASLEQGAVVHAVAPVFQHYLTGKV
jgi:AcrR family transcriptional regulator